MLLYAHAMLLWQTTNLKIARQCTKLQVKYLLCKKCKHFDIWNLLQPCSLISLVYAGCLTRQMKFWWLLHVKYHLQQSKHSCQGIVFTATRSKSLLVNMNQTYYKGAMQRKNGRQVKCQFKFKAYWIRSNVIDWTENSASSVNLTLDGDEKKSIFFY